MSVTRRKSLLSRHTVNGPEYGLGFDIDAASDQAALDTLATITGVVRGSPYIDPQGLVPDQFCVCTDFEVEARVAARPGQEGLYGVVAWFRRPQPGAPRPGFDSAPRYRIERTHEIEPYEIDTVGNWAQNTAEVPLSPLPTRKVSRATLVIDWVVSGQDYGTVWNAYKEFDYTINSAVFAGAPRGCLLCEGIDVQETGIPKHGVTNQWYFRLSTRMAFRSPFVVNGVTYEGYDDVRKNVGYSLWINEGGTWSLVDQNIPEPRNLNANGTAFLEKGATPLVLVFKPYYYSDFSAIGV